ncbi:MAG: methyl-accepting chemotaxis protein [Ketobacteraceae bacterium]|nr:methyl-accepting chemotaxis protein [Ketobacteraceae bacterium]
MTIRRLTMLLVSVFVLLLVGTSLSVEFWSMGAQGSGEIINKAGRQRMLTQKMTKEALLVSAGAGSKQVLEQTVALFDENLEFLAAHENSRNPDSELARKYANAMEQWSAFRPGLLSIRNNTDSEALEELSDRSMKLLKVSNEAVILLERRGQANVSLLQMICVLFIGLGILVGVGALFAIKRILLDPLDRLESITNRIVQEHDLRIRLNLQGNNELTRVAGSFDRLLDGFESMYRKANDIENTIYKDIESVTTILESNKQSIDRQANEIIQISTAMTEMAHSVQEVAQNTESASATANDTEQASTSGSNLLRQNIATINQLAEEVNQAFVYIQELAAASQEISGIAESISNIAEQTNLLALNAAIEAARAGEQGRGFAVVADEVRTLAQRTQEATGQIHSILTKFQEKTTVCVNAMESSKSRSDACIEHSQSLDSAFADIRSAIESLNALNHQVAVATQEQSSVSDDISKNVVEIENQSHDIVTGAEKTLEVLRQLSGAAQQLRQELKTYRA